jgi:bifunctional enzyme CysN/CysC
MPLAFPPMSVTLCLEDEVDISRGDMIVHVQHRPHVSRRVDAQVVWMSERPLERDREYLIKHTTQKVRARVAEVRYKVDVNSLQKQSSEDLRLNEIGAVVVETVKPLFVDPYRRNRITGSFILIDAISNETVAAGMVTGRELRETDVGAILEGLEYSSPRITPADREKRYGHQAIAIWLVGSAEAAYVLEKALFDRGCHVHVLADPQHVEVLPELARICNAAGMITICAVPADHAAERERARKIVGADRFLDLDTAALGGSAEDAAAGAVRVLEEKGIV